MFGVDLEQTSSNNIQDLIESRVEKRTKGVYVPVGGKKMLTFMDDFNMPSKDAYGSQPPLELIRLWLDYGFWYDRVRQTVRYIRVSNTVFSCQVYYFASRRGRWSIAMSVFVSMSFCLLDRVIMCYINQLLTLTLH